MESVNFCSFSPCDMHHKDEPIVRAVEMTDPLFQKFKMRFNNFHSHDT